MPSPRIPLVGSYTNRNPNPSATSTKDQLFVNCFPDVVKNPITGEARVHLNKRPGCAGSTAAGSGYSGSIGACVWTSFSNSTTPAVFSFGDSINHVVEVWGGGGLQIGADFSGANAADTCLSLTETTTSGVGQLVAVNYLVSTAVSKTWYFPVGGAWTQITDLDYPTNQTPALVLAGEPAHMDGYMFVMTTNGQLWHSNLNSLSAWTLTSVITAQASPDGGVGLARYRNLIAAFGRYSVEFFQNAGNTSGSVLAPIPNLAFRIGAAPNSVGQRTILPVKDTIYWIGVNADSGLAGIYRLNGFTPEKISTTPVDTLLNQQGATVSLSGTIGMGGMTHLVTGLILSDSKLLVYCIDLNIWWLYNFQDKTNGVIQAAVGTPGASRFVVSGTMNTDGKVYLIDPNSPVWQDDGVAYTATIQTELLDFGTANRKFFPELRVIGDTQSSASNLAVSWSDDDYATFSTPVNIDLSKLDKKIHRLGSSKNRRAFKFTHAANTPCRLEAVEFSGLEGGSA